MRTLIVISVLVALNSIAARETSYTRTLLLMGSRFDITVVDRDSTKAEQYIDIAIEEIRRIERLISSWDSSSETSTINRLAGKKAVPVSEELFSLIQRSIAISRLTDGAFDISYASMDRIWKFDGSMTSMPTKQQIKKSVERVGFSQIVLNKQNKTVFLKQEGMKIGFGAIGKGYAADRAKQVLISKGVSAGIINASGDMNTWGKHPSGKPWIVGIKNPLNKNKVFASLPIDNRAVVTSGNYEKFMLFNGKRYTHIIDPRTGYPSTGIASVTIIAPQAELADALATSVFVMGIETGMDRINQIPKVDCIVIDDNGKMWKSKEVKLNRQK